MGETKLRRELLALLLGDAENYHSGESISAALGLTRSAVWKEIDRLRAEGYRVESATNRGYRIAAVPDALTAPLVRYWLGQEREQPFDCLPEVESTNLYLQQRAFAGADSGTAVFAEAQTAGRGRRGRSFFSPPGGLYFSYLLRPGEQEKNLNLLTSFAGLLVCDTLNALGAKARIKWPNDVLQNGKKLCGILTNLVSDAETASLTAAVVGVGINIAGAEIDFPEELRDKAGSLQQIGVSVPRAKLAALLLRAFDRAFLAENWLAENASEQVRRLRELSCVVGQRVTIVEPTRQWEATALGIAENGGLVVSGDRGTVTITSGEVSVRGLLGYR